MMKELWINLYTCIIEAEYFLLLLKVNRAKAKITVTYINNVVICNTFQAGFCFRYDCSQI